MTIAEPANAAKAGRPQAEADTEPGDDQGDRAQAAAEASAPSSNTAAAASSVRLRPRRSLIAPPIRAPQTAPSSSEAPPPAGQRIRGEIES